jgi:hypothetical protein
VSSFGQGRGEKTPNPTTSRFLAMEIPVDLVPEVRELPAKRRAG